MRNKNMIFKKEFELKIIYQLIWKYTFINYIVAQKIKKRIKKAREN